MPEALINEFVKIIYDYVKHGKMVDEKFYRNIYQLFSVSIYGRKLEKFVYIDEISRYDDENEKYTKRLESIIGLAAYNSEEKELIVYQDNLDRESQCITMKQSLNVVPAMAINIFGHGVEGKIEEVMKRIAIIMCQKMSHEMKNYLLQ